MRFGFRLWGVCAIALLASAGAAMAWGPEGHQVVARIAARHLEPQARQQVEILLGAPAAESMAALSSWADWQGRARPETKPWHYVDIPIDAAGYVSARDCRDGQCVVAAIAREEATLADGAQSREARREALLWVIHLAGDIHQPLHCADDNHRGGNDVPVSIGVLDSNLHRVWDSNEVWQLGIEAAPLAARLDRTITPPQEKAWSRGTPADWANEAHALARGIYARLPAARPVPMARPGMLRDSPIAARQLEKAGIRLAFLINQALGSRSQRRAAAVEADSARPYFRRRRTKP